MHWRLKEKLLVLSILTAVIPFMGANIYWYFNAQNTTQEDAKNTINLVTTQAADKVNDFINIKLLGFLTHSQGAALLSQNLDLSQEDLLNLLLQEPDIQSLALLDTKGHEKIRVDKQQVYPKSQLQDLSNSAAFKIASFKFGKEYISPVSYSSGEPMVIISVPVTYPLNSLSLKTFSSDSLIPRSPDSVLGVLLGTVSLGQLSSKLESLQVQKTGYVYIVDAQGVPMTYPRKEFIGVQTKQISKTEIEQFTNNWTDSLGIPTQTKSLTGVDVMSNHKKISKTGWGIITEVPQADIVSDVQRIQRQTIAISIIPFSAIIILSIFFAQGLIRPIEYLVKGTESLSKSNFNFDFAKVQTGDELQQLAQSFEQMSKKIEHEQHSLNAEKNTLTTVLANIVDGVIALDSSFRIVFLNQVAKTHMNFKGQQVIGKNIDKVIIFKEKDEQTSIEDIIIEIKTSNLTISNAHKLVYPISPTENRTINLVVSPINISTETNIKYLITFYDITKEQELENMKLDFVSMAAHELRTPLTAIKGYLAYLHEELVSKITPDETTYLNRVMISSDQLSSLIENLLNVTKIERGVLKLDLGEFSMEKLIEESLVNLDQVAEQRKVKLTFIHPKTTLQNVLGDKFRIGQVFTNLVSNGLTYTHPGGEVEVSIQQQPDSIIVSVKDNGQGIPQSAIPHLFTKFYRVGGALEQGSKGTGLGLFISKSIIDRHNGKIWVESEVDKGSTFYFMLPLQSI